MSQADDLRDTQLLVELSGRLITESHASVLYQEILKTAIALTKANAGTLQILDRHANELVLLATHGFERNATDHFARVSAGSNTTCGMALKNNQRTFIDFDDPNHDDPDGSIRLHIDAGYLSAQSTPLVTRGGETIGMVSTHWHEHHYRAAERELHFIDLLARLAADLIEQHRNEDALRQRVGEGRLELYKANETLLAEVQERRTAEARVKKLLRQLVHAQEEERRTIARELHDTLGQQLAALHVSIEIIRSKIDGNISLREDIERVRQIFDRVNSDVDFLAWELRPPALDLLGLDAALETFVREWSEQFGIEASYEAVGMTGTRLGPEVEINLYRIFQEALQNIHKHAGATSVNVVLETHDGYAVLIIEDNGKGYATEIDGSTEEGMGLTNMRERAALIGGKVEVESEPGGGTAILVRVPLQEVSLKEPL